MNVVRTSVDGIPCMITKALFYAREGEGTANLASKSRIKWTWMHAFFQLFCFFTVNILKGDKLLSQIENAYLLLSAPQFGPKLGFSLPLTLSSLPVSLPASLPPCYHFLPPSLPCLCIKQFLTRKSRCISDPHDTYQNGLLRIS